MLEALCKTTVGYDLCCSLVANREFNILWDRLRTSISYSIIIYKLYSEVFISLIEWGVTQLEYLPQPTRRTNHNHVERPKGLALPPLHEAPHIYSQVYPAAPPHPLDRHLHVEELLLQPLN